MVTSHLERCAACRAYRGDLTAFTAAIREAPHERMESRLVLPRPRRPIAGRVRAGVAVAALAVGALVLAGRTSLPNPQRPALIPITKRPAVYQSQRQLERELAIVARAQNGSPISLDGRAV
jgi:hypothetical protein